MRDLPIFARLSRALLATLWITLLMTALPTLPAAAQEEGGGTMIQNIPFETLPAGVDLVGPGGITLDGPTAVTGSLTVAGILESTIGGILFPDGTVQTTAATTSGAQTANSGLYNNRIPDFTPPQPYSEICFKAGSVQSDIHAISESPAGGLCEPGDLGWIIERDERTAATWEAARVQCLLQGMRLPEPFEWRVSCVDAATFGLNDMTGNAEWASNAAIPLVTTSSVGIGATIFGFSTCSSASFSWVGRGTPSSESEAYRCLL